MKWTIAAGARACLNFSISVISRFPGTDRFSVAKFRALRDDNSPESSWLFSSPCRTSPECSFWILMWASMADGAVPVYSWTVLKNIGQISHNSPGPFLRTRISRSEVQSAVCAPCQSLVLIKFGMKDNQMEYIGFSFCVVCWRGPRSRPTNLGYLSVDPIGQFASLHFTWLHCLLFHVYCSIEHFKLVAVLRITSQEKQNHSGKDLSPCNCKPTEPIKWLRNAAIFDHMHIIWRHRSENRSPLWPPTQPLPNANALRLKPAFPDKEGRILGIGWVGNFMRRLKASTCSRKFSDDSHLNTGRPSCPSPTYQDRAREE